MKLIRLSFTISIAGIFLLLLFSNFLLPKLIEINKLDTSFINKQVQAKGNIKSIKSYDSFQIITIEDSTGKISITLNKLTNLTINQTITVVGKVTEYKNNLQIQANKIIS